MVPHEEIARELNRLAACYPALRFGTDTGWDRKTLRWVPERIDGLAPGLHTAITTDLDELRAALDADVRLGHWLTREAALRALL